MTIASREQVTCEFGLCRRPAEHQVSINSDAGECACDPLVVCALHVTPAAEWGRADVQNVAICPLW